MSRFYNDAIFWVEVEKIKPNPYQPRKEFDEARLNDLASSIRQYGVLQPLVVTRKEIVHEDGIISEYELIAGERRLRASKIAGLSQVPVIIRANEEDARTKLELAIIENVQREDLNPIDRAFAFQKLVEEFHFKHIQIGEKIGKSREYVSNSIRLLGLTQEIKDAVSAGRISEGHTRPLLMLADRPEEQTTLFKEIMTRKLTVREAEALARKVALNKVRKKGREFDPDIVAIEERLSESFGTRVRIETNAAGGKILIDFFSDEDFSNLLGVLSGEKKGAINNERGLVMPTEPVLSQEPEGARALGYDESANIETQASNETSAVEETPIDDRSAEEKKEEDIYGLDSFSI
jgi:ParB family chromosome partitioning protein